MSTHLSRHFTEQRLAKGLKPGQLARLAGYENVGINGGRIRSFEMSGDISQELFQRIVTVLEIPPTTIEQLVEKDRQEYFEAWLDWVNEPIQPHLITRWMAAVYRKQVLPIEITTMEGAETWASSVARENKMRCCLVWSRKTSSWFDEKGSLSIRTEAKPGEPNSPWIKFGGKGPRFLF